MDFRSKEFACVKNPRFGVQTKPVGEPEPINPFNSTARKTIQDARRRKNRSAKREILSSSEISSPLNITAGTGISINPSILTSCGTIGLKDLEPSPAGVFYNMNASINHQGQVIAASNGTRGTVTSITCGAGLQKCVITDEGTICLQENGITSNFLADGPDSLIPGTYSCADLTLTKKGLIIAAKNGSVVKRIDVGSGLVRRLPMAGVVTLDVSPSIGLTGTPTAPTAPPSSNNSQIATTAYVDSAIETAIKSLIAAMSNTK